MLPPIQEMAIPCAAIGTGILGIAFKISTGMGKGSQ